MHTCQFFLNVRNASLDLKLTEINQNGQVIALSSTANEANDPIVSLDGSFSVSYQLSQLTPPLDEHILVAINPHNSQTWFLPQQTNPVPLGGGLCSTGPFNFSFMKQLPSTSLTPELHYTVAAILTNESVFQKINAMNENSTPKILPEFPNSQTNEYTLLDSVAIEATP